MTTCPTCRHYLVRTHRTRLQKVFYRDAFRCSHCDYRNLDLRSPLDLDLAFFFSRFTRCVRCGNERIQSLPERDQLDSTSRHPTSLFFRLTGAPIRKCPFCRLQYYDWRPLNPAVSRTSRVR